MNITKLWNPNKILAMVLIKVFLVSHFIHCEFLPGNFSQSELQEEVTSLCSFIKVVAKITGKIWCIAVCHVTQHSSEVWNMCAFNMNISNLEDRWEMTIKKNEDGLCSEDFSVLAMKTKRKRQVNYINDNYIWSNDNKGRKKAVGDILSVPRAKKRS